MNKKEKGWKEKLEKVVTKRWGKEYIGTHPYCEMYDIVEMVLQQEIDRAREDTEVDRIKWALRELPKLTEGKDFREDNWSVIVEKLKTKLTK